MSPLAIHASLGQDPVTATPKNFDFMVRTVVTELARPNGLEDQVANKDKGGKNNKKAPTKDLKQKRQAKKEKKSVGARKSG